MKIWMIIFWLFPWMLINAQVIDWDNFNEKAINEVTFRELNEYTLTEGGYSLSLSSSEHYKIYNFIRKKNEKYLLNVLISRINEIVPTSSVGIIDSLSCKDLKDYQDIARRCITDWVNSPSDAFFMIGCGKKVDVISYYNYKSKTVYITCVFQD